MIQLKSAKEIERMKAPAAINAEVLAIVRENVLEGVSTYDLDRISLFPHLPDSEVVRSDVADYYQEVQGFDADVGRALARLEVLGELDRTIVLITIG